MNELEFSTLVRDLVSEYVNEHTDRSDAKMINPEDVYIVSIYYLQNNKALASTTLFDGMYYEITYNGDKNEIYFDAYKKWESRCIKVDRDN